MGMPFESHISKDGPTVIRSDLTKIEIGEVIQCIAKPDRSELAIQVSDIRLFALLVNCCNKRDADNEVAVTEPAGVFPAGNCVDYV